MVNKINFKTPFPYIGIREEKYVTKILHSKRLSVRSSSTVLELEQLFSKITKNKYCLAVCNGTSALHIILKTLGIQPEDEIIMPVVNYIGVPYAVLYCGARPVFCDVAPNSPVSEAADFEKLVTKNTKAIIASTLFGIAPNMDKIRQLVRKYNLILIEDLSQSYGLKINHQFYRPVGGIGFYSLSDSKNITTSEGGLVVTDSQALYKKISLIANLGEMYTKNQQPTYPSFDYSQKVDYKILAYTYRMSPVLAAIGLAQLTRTAQIIKKRSEISTLFQNKLSKFTQIILPSTGLGYSFCLNALPIIITCSTRKRQRIRQICLNKKIPISLTYFTEIIDYSIFKNLLTKDKYPNAQKFKKQNFVIPINLNFNRATNEYMIDQFCKILKSEKIC